MGDSGKSSETLLNVLWKSFGMEMELLGKKFGAGIEPKYQRVLTFIKF